MGYASVMQWWQIVLGGLVVAFVCSQASMEWSRLFLRLDDLQESQRKLDQKLDFLRDDTAEVTRQVQQIEREMTREDRARERDWNLANPPRPE